MDVTLGKFLMDILNLGWFSIWIDAVGYDEVYGKYILFLKKYKLKIVFENNKIICN